MKILKINLTFLKITCLFLTIGLMTACQDEKLEITEPTLELDELGSGLVLPFGFDTEDESKVAEYLYNLSDEAIDELKENARVVNYLADQKVLGDVNKDIEEGQLYTDLDLTLYLSKKQMDELAVYTPVERAVTRGCTITHYTCNAQYDHWYICSWSYYSPHCNCRVTSYWLWCDANR